MHRRLRLRCGVRQWAAYGTAATAVTIGVATAVAMAVAAAGALCFGIGLGIDAQPSRQQSCGNIAATESGLRGGLHEAGGYRHLGACGCG